MAHKIIACTRLVTVPLTSSLTGFDQTSKWTLIWVTQAKQLNPKKQEIKHKTGGSGCGSVGRAIASDTRGPWFEPVIGKICIEHLFTCLLSAVLKRRK